MGLLNTDNNFPEFLQDQVESRIGCGHKWLKPTRDGEPTGRGPCPICKRESEQRGRPKAQLTKATAKGEFKSRPQAKPGKGKQPNV